MASIQERVIEIIAEQLGKDKDQIKPDSTFVDLGADSLDTAELVMEFEDEFGINIPEDEEGILTVKDAVSYIESKMGDDA